MSRMHIDKQKKVKYNISNIMDILTPEDREFIGFFMGEGCLMIQRVTSYNAKALTDYYRPVIVISLRDDDYKVLEWLVKRFGGQVERKKKTYYKNQQTTSNPRCTWRIISNKRCREILSVLLKVKLPYKKALELETFRQFLDTTPGTGRSITPEIRAKQKALKEKLSSLKKYNVR